MTMRNKFFFIATVVGAILTSCLGKQSEGLSENAKITSFSLKYKDTTIDLSKIKYDIKEISKGNGTITPVDSLPYGTKLEALVVTLGQSRLSSAKIFETKDGVRQKEFDALDKSPDTVNFTDIVYIETTAADKKTHYLYKVMLYAHKQDPDLYLWSGILTNAIPQNITQEKLVRRDSVMMWYTANGSALSVYTSSDGKSWQAKTPTGLPAGIDLRYMLAVGDSLYMAHNTDLYRSADGLTWQRKTTTKSVDNLLCSIGGNIYAIDNTSLKLYRLAAGDWELLQLATPSRTLPDNFPVDGAGIWSDRSANGVDRVYIAGGVDKGGNLLGSVWTSENGLYWVNIGSNSTLMTPRRDVAVFQYDDKLMLIGGKDNSGIVTTNYYIYSPDYGITWATATDKMKLSPLFSPRYNAQVVVMPKKKRIYIVGGRAADGSFIKDVWAGGKNSLVWKVDKK